MTKQRLNTEIKPMLDPDNGAVTGYYCKGHIPGELFIPAVRELAGREPNVTTFNYIYLRNRPLLPAERECHNCTSWMEMADKGRGAYPATVVEL